MKVLTTNDVAKILGVSPSTVAKWRTLGEGPRATRRGKKIFIYNMADVLAYGKEANYEINMPNDILA